MDIISPLVFLQPELSAPASCAQTLQDAPGNNVRNLESRDVPSVTHVITQVDMNLSHGFLNFFMFPFNDESGSEFHYRSKKCHLTSLL